MIEALLPVMRELGLVTIFEDLNFGNVQDLFDENEIRSIKLRSPDRQISKRIDR